jgi:hypothetical protein
MSDMDESVITDKLPLTMEGEKSDRVLLENRIDKMVERSDERMSWIVASLKSQRNWLILWAVIVLITLGMATASFGVQMWRIKVMAEHGELK